VRAGTQFLPINNHAGGCGVVAAACNRDIGVVARVSIVARCGDGGVVAREVGGTCAGGDMIIVITCVRDIGVVMSAGGAYAGGRGVIIVASVGDGGVVVDDSSGISEDVGDTGDVDKGDVGSGVDASTGSSEGGDVIRIVVDGDGGRGVASIIADGGVVARTATWCTPVGAASSSSSSRATAATSTRATAADCLAAYLTAVTTFLFVTYAYSFIWKRAPCLIMALHIYRESSR
jgi:hypothetical protein